jgi:hypothetical protein
MSVCMAKLFNRARVPDAVRHEAMNGFTRVFDALWRGGAPLIRDRRSPFL